MEVKRTEISVGHNKSNITKQINVSWMTVHRVTEGLKKEKDLKVPPQVVNHLAVIKAFRSDLKLKMTALMKNNNLVTSVQELKVHGKASAQ
uniref:Uncharacterized protein n=1 Tax=Octopus bimaculoides TaxID=37653 RepID=A0A0L8FT88_OCTBM